MGINIKKISKSAQGSPRTITFLQNTSLSPDILSAVVTTVLTSTVTVHRRGLYKFQVSRQMWSFSAIPAPIWIIFDVYTCLTLMAKRLRIFSYLFDKFQTVFRRAEKKSCIPVARPPHRTRSSELQHSRADSNTRGCNTHGPIRTVAANASGRTMSCNSSQKSRIR